MKRILALSLILLAAACSSATAPDPTPSQEQGGVPPNCWQGYHPENQGSGVVCTPNH